ncbi:MAG TPA: hypothetical protein VF122_02750 [Caulobacteraceae bacterium]
MTTFSPTDAALEGFRISREQPRVLLIWSAVNLVVSLVMAVALVSLFGPTLVELEAMGASGSNDPAEAMATLEKLAPLYALVLPIGLAMVAVMRAAVYRAVLRPSDSAYGYLRLGSDELRLVGLVLIYLVLAIGFIFALVLVAGLLAGGLAAALGAGFGALFGALIGLAAVCFIIFVAVRLSLAGPMTFAERRLRVFESWTLTRGHFWRLAGTYVLAVALALVVALLAMVIYMALAAVAAGGDLSRVGQVFAPDMSSLGAYFTLGMILYLLFSAAVSAVWNAVVYAPPAFAYRDLSGASES